MATSHNRNNKHRPLSLSTTHYRPASTSTSTLMSPNINSLLSVVESLLSRTLLGLMTFLIYTSSGDAMKLNAIYWRNNNGTWVPWNPASSNETETGLKRIRDYGSSSDSSDNDDGGLSGLEIFGIVACVILGVLFFLIWCRSGCPGLGGGCGGDGDDDD